MIEKPFISLEEFKIIISKIQEQQRKTEAFDTALENMCGGFSIAFDTENEYLSALLLLLNKIFKEKDKPYPTLDWFLYEQPNKMYYQNYELIPTVESIYEILVAEMQTDKNVCKKMTKKIFRKYGTKKVANKN